MEESKSAGSSHPRSKRYSAIMHTARELFWKYGFKRVSVEEICEKSGVSKMTFYRFFPNKLELAKAVFDEVINNGLVAFRNILETSKFNTAQKIQMMLALKMNGTYDISQEFLQDFYNNPELGLKDHIEKRTKSVWQEVIEDFKKAQKKKIFRKDFKPELLFYISQKFQELVNDKSMLALYDNPQALIMDVANLMIYGIAPREDKHVTD
jgi:AcrR family transcriptional regulator